MNDVWVLETPESHVLLVHTTGKAKVGLVRNPQVAEHISLETRRKVMENFVWRLQECVRMQGSHLEHVL